MVMIWGRGQCIPVLASQWKTCLVSLLKLPNSAASSYKDLNSLDCCCILSVSALLYWAHLWETHKGLSNINNKICHGAIELIVVTTYLLA